MKNVNITKCMHELSLSLKWRDPADIIPQEKMQGIFFPWMPKAEEEEAENASLCILQYMLWKPLEFFGAFVIEGEKKKEKNK